MAGTNNEASKNSGEKSEWIRAHEALSILARERAAADAEEGRWLLAALRSAAHVHLGYGSFTEYIERLFGYKPRSTQEKLPRSRRARRAACHRGSARERRAELVRRTRAHARRGPGNRVCLAGRCSWQGPCTSWKRSWSVRAPATGPLPPASLMRGATFFASKWRPKRWRSSAKP